MLAHHLQAVCENVENIFFSKQNRFLENMFGFIRQRGMDTVKMYEHLMVVALLHDIGKTEDDKSIEVPHPLFGYSTVKRHSVVGVYAAMDILGNDHTLSAEDKSIIFSVIEEHDVSYGLFREYKQKGLIPTSARWHELNAKISAVHGEGLLYLLLFKLADIHGHANIEDVTWFYQRVNQDYFMPVGLHLPIPRESDIR